LFNLIRGFGSEHVIIFIIYNNPVELGRGGIKRKRMMKT